MTYYLGIDIGTTYTAAAVWRDGRNEIASLGNRAPTIPSVVLLRDDEAVLTGEAAVRRAATEPGRVAREFKRRVGDPTPIIVGGTPYSADALMAKLLRWVVDQVSGVEGGPPAGIAVSHPANWGNYKLDLLRQAISIADLDDVATVSEPEAAAIHYASQARVEPGSVIAVYDLGGGTFDAAVLRKTGARWDVLGSPEGIERLGGVDFDQAVYHHVAQALGGALESLDPDDPTAHAAVARLRQECVDAKEALSSDSDVSIPVMLPNLQTEVRLTRGEYEGMIRPALADTITAMNRALRSAKVTPDEVTAVLLVGGSSRTPLVAELVSSALGRPVAVDAHPKHGVALGAAITAATRTTGATQGKDEATPGDGGDATGPRADIGAVAPVAAGAAATALAGLGTAPLRDDDGVPSAPVATPAVTAAVPSPAPTVSSRLADTRVAGDVPTARATRAVDDLPAGRATRPVVDRSPGRDQRSVTVPYREPAAAERSADRTAGSRTAVGTPPRPRGGPGGRDHVGPPDRTGGPGGRPGGAGSGRGGSSSSRALVVAIGVIVVLALAGGAALVLLGGADDDTPETTTPGGATDDTAAGDEGDSGASPADAPATTPSPTPGEFVQINDVVLDGGHYRVDYDVTGYVPDEAGLHIHFFPNTVEPQNAGNNGDPPGDWHLTGEPDSFVTKYTPDGVGEATQMCSAVATAAHDVHRPEVRTGTCMDLPPA